VDVAFAMTALDVVLLGRIPHGGGRESAADVRIARRALARAGVAELAARSYPTLSGGEKQCVQIARAFAQVWPDTGQASPYLLLDEPIAALDLVRQHRIAALLRRSARRGAGVFAVLHDLSLATDCADDVVVLRRGRVVAAGKPSEALTPDVIRDVFGVRARLLRRRGRAPWLVTLSPARRSREARP